MRTVGNGYQGVHEEWWAGLSSDRKSLGASMAKAVHDHKHAVEDSIG